MQVTTAHLAATFGIDEASIAAEMYSAGIDALEFGDNAEAIAYPEAAYDFLAERYDPVEAPDEVSASQPTFIPATCNAKLVPAPSEYRCEL